VKLAVLASGSGTILEAMIAQGIDVALVIVDRTCRASEVAARYGRTVLEIDRRSFGEPLDRERFTETVTEALLEHDIDLVAMAGYGTILTQYVHDRFPLRVLNTHPSLLPAFPGWHAVRDALDYGVKVTGCTVHLATAIVDSGPILAQAALVIGPDDDESALHERIKGVERSLYPRVVASYMALLQEVDDDETLRARIDRFYLGEHSSTKGV
jgi:phosphoribosylglycinamide formyltransferase-1